LVEFVIELLLAIFIVVAFGAGLALFLVAVVYVIECADIPYLALMFQIGCEVEEYLMHISTG
jgi:hypothetical protein